MKLDVIDYKFYDGTTRPIYVLRPNVFEPGKKYKTLYFFDGTSTFVGSEYTKKSWEVERAFDQVGLEDYIAVGLEHAGNFRMQEYLPYDFEHHGKIMESRAEDFDNFFINDLIPYIEGNYPVIKDRQARALAGSSMGGWITAAYAAKHKDTFTKFGIFSLASWVTHDSRFIKYVDSYGLDKDSSYYVYVGSKEGYNKEFDVETVKVTKAYLKESEDFVAYLQNRGIKNYAYDIGQDLNHSEESWAQYLPNFLNMIK